jgi:hypothetical protein
MYWKFRTISLLKKFFGLSSFNINKLANYTGSLNIFVVMAVACRVPTLEETIVQVCAEVCTCCPTLNAVQVAGACEQTLIVF